MEYIPTRFRLSDGVDTEKVVHTDIFESIADRIKLAGMGGDYTFIDLGVSEPYGDGTGHLRTNADRIDLVDVTRTERTMVHRLPAVAHSDFVLDFDLAVSNNSGNDTFIASGCSDTDFRVSGSYNDTGNGVYFECYGHSVGRGLRLVKVVSGVITAFGYYEISLGQAYYCRISRLNVTATLSIYSDAARTNLLSTITGSCPNTLFTHEYLAVARVSIISTATLTMWLDNFVMDGEPWNLVGYPDDSPSPASVKEYFNSGETLNMAMAHTFESEPTGSALEYYVLLGGALQGGGWLSLAGVQALGTLVIPASPNNHLEITVRLNSNGIVTPEVGRFMGATVLPVEGGEECDYPVNSDVRAGVIFNHGANTGTLKPAPSVLPPDVDFEDIEAQIIAYLKDGMPYLDGVESYGGQLDDEIEKLPFKSRIAYVSYGGSNYNPVDGPSHEEHPKFTVLLARKNPRGNKAIRKDDGIYKMIKDCLSILVNENFGNNKILPLAHVDSSLIFFSQTIAVYGITFQTSFDNTYNWE